MFVGWNLWLEQLACSEVDCSTLYRGDKAMLNKMQVSDRRNLMLVSMMNRPDGHTTSVICTML